MIARVLALQDMTANVDGESKSLKHGRYYSIPVHVATELQRAGYVQITNNIDEMGNVREVAVSPAVTNRETAEVRKIKPRRRKVKANVSGDSD